ncbi:glyceraldehyde-3-phosphate dehydrogenase, type II [Caldisphaera lagunensis DSM 15908]|uniref:Glyceraldehyde-3-phosphate dehydrogenase n=1 Tax=Caldisphaera lagunensis (strain DSM 15908 / JCM 11604 / ANMR 0165 / IC-154) TaxID=1056495 RepID=L0A9A6_CALLD|nr:type II glyceraldehyde-3-phosphate dehydrogenase [Caldisphaera lagunensis]AFZ70483.1 glyceraldehyde-3-phosphate dehydrogenase, type II [Caldisphaera lagunensis DSM 15908]
MKSKVKVAINGFGTIGKRVAIAINKQDDMVVSGIVKIKPDYNALFAKRMGMNIYTIDKEDANEFKKKGIEVYGTIEDLIKESDIIVDATPDGVGENYKKLYNKYGINSIFQGGEEANIADISFNALCNYDEAYGKKSIRVVSCNTTGLLRSICALSNLSKIEKVNAVLIRRGADPQEIKKGPINSIVLNPVGLPSHHALDVKTVIPWINISTAAVVVPTTLMHVHHVTIRFSNKVEKNDILEALMNSPRIILVDSAISGIQSTSQIIDSARLSKERGDINELVVFKDSITVDDNEVQFFQAVHQESIVVPENIDAIRASLELSSKMESINKTDKKLGINKILY